MGSGRYPHPRRGGPTRCAALRVPAALRSLSERFAQVHEPVQPESQSCFGRDSNLLALGQYLAAATRRRSQGGPARK